jgi:hypothetical protein
MEHGIVEGIHLFNTQNFFEAHEALETVWLKAKGHRKTFVHGLIQVAAAFHHHAHRNPAGLYSLLEKGYETREIRGKGRGPGPGELDARTSAVAGTFRPILLPRTSGAAATTNQIDNRTIERLSSRSRAESSPWAIECLNHC